MKQRGKVPLSGKLVMGPVPLLMRGTPEAPLGVT